MMLPAISIRQPWAWAVVSGHKTFETRDGYLAPMGYLVIHSSKTFNTMQFRADINYCKEKGVSVPDKNDLAWGCLIGLVEFGSISCSKITGINEIETLCYSLNFEKPKLFSSPVPCRSDSSFFTTDLPPDLAPDFSGVLREATNFLLTISKFLDRRDSHLLDICLRLIEEDHIVENRNEVYSILRRDFYKLLIEGGIYLPFYWDYYYGEPRQ